MNTETSNERISKNLKNLYLDPNNYRFADVDGYIPVPEDKVLDERVQKRTRVFIEGKNREGIKDLIASFKANGYLDVDIIQATKVDTNKFVVLEGNRRVTALKALQEDYDNGLDIGNLNPGIFRSVNFEIHSNEERDKHLVVMGLKHISGNRKWPVINQAKLIYDYLKEYFADRQSYLEAEEILCNSLGLTKHKLRSLQRVYHLVLEYKESEFGDQYDSSKFGIFEEIIKKPKLKSWLDWDDEKYTAINKANQERLFSWISSTNNLESDEEQEPIITKSLEVRELVDIIEDEKALNIMEKENSLSRGYASSGLVDDVKYKSALDKFENTLNDLRLYKDYLASDDLSVISNLRTKVNDVFPEARQLFIQEGNQKIAFDYGDVKHLSEISIKDYKTIHNLKIEKLNKINIFAGLNNSGKTSLIEAVYLLTKSNDISEFLRIYRLKSKQPVISANWLNEVFSKDVSIDAVFNEIPCSLLIQKYEDDEIDRGSDYISSYKFKSTIDDKSFESNIDTFELSEISRKSGGVEHLCRSSFKSPYFHDFDRVIYEYSKSAELKTEQGSALSIVIDFLKDIDKKIKNITLIEYNDVRRFLVENSESNLVNLDLTDYGEGLQRIFYIALSFAASKNGIVCIDEFETAIHFSLLKEFTIFVQRLSDIFNVQVFITSHSKECINAFVLNDFKNSEISAYNLVKEDDDLDLKYIGGERLKVLVDNIGLDIRGE